MLDFMNLMSETQEKMNSLPTNSVIKRKDWFTYSIVGINILFYIYNLFVNGTDAIKGLTQQQMVKVGAMYEDSPFITLILSMFSHYSLAHLFTNMLILILLSSIVLDNFSMTAYVVAYLGGGLISNMATKLFDPALTSLGASGAVWSIMGMLLIGTIASTSDRFFPRLAKNDLILMIFILIGANIFFTLYNEHLNNTSHFIGLVFGGIVTLVYMARHRKDHLNAR